MDPIMEFLLAMQEETRAGQEKVKSNQAKADARHEQMMADWKAWHEEMRASRKETAAKIEPKTEVKTLACQEMEAHQEERQPTSLDRKPKVAQKEEVPKVDTEVMLDSIYVLHVKHVKNIYTGPLTVQAQYSRFCPISSSFHYSGSLVT
jgi:hypothetical protein